jgi:hypothetical protein
MVPTASPPLIGEIAEMPSVFRRSPESAGERRTTKMSRPSVSFDKFVLRHSPRLPQFAEPPNHDRNSKNRSAESRRKATRL